jgi:hypothetical protein
MEKRGTYRLTLLCLLPVGGIACAGSDEVHPDDVTTADLSLQPADDGEEAAPPGPTDPPPPPPMRPPQEAFQACAALAAGAACTVAIDDRQIEGACRQGPPGAEALVCVPADMPPPPPRQARGHGGPPRVALEACHGLAGDAVCSFEIDGHTIDGTCRQGPGGQGALACAPANMPPMGGPPGPPREALAACDDLAADAACSFQMAGRAVDGTCWAPPAFAGAPLACAPPQIRARFAPPAPAR